MLPPLRTLVVLAALCLTAPLAFAQNPPPIPALSPAAPADKDLLPPIETGQRVYTVGHSFHFWVAPIITEMAKAAGIEGAKSVGVSLLPRSWVVDHWAIEDGPDESNPIKRALKEGKVDVLTLSPIWLPDIGIRLFAAYGLKYNPNLRVTVQEFWLPNDRYNPRWPMVFDPVDFNPTDLTALKEAHAAYFRDMDAYVTEVNRKVGQNVCVVVPVGQAVLALREKILAGQAPGIATQKELFKDVKAHPREVIQTLAAYCHFAVIYRRSPIGLPVPEILTKSKVPPADQPALNTLLQNLAWDAVRAHPMSGLTQMPPPEPLAKPKATPPTDAPE